MTKMQTKGKQKGKRKQKMGPEGQCLCPQCDKTVPHAKGTPCVEMRCPDCGTMMVRKARRQMPATSAGSEKRPP
jgi:hypothetical protein